MLKTLLKFLLLGALTTGAANLPGMLGKQLPVGRLLGGIHGGGAGSASSRESAELAGALSQLPQTLDLLKNGDQDLENEIEDLPPGERELMREATQGPRFRSNTLTRKLGLAPGSGGGERTMAVSGLAGRLLAGHTAKPDWQSFSSYRRMLLRFYASHQAGMAVALWLAPAAAVLLAGLLLLVKRYTLSMTLSSLLFTLATFLIWLLSASVALSALLTKQSLLAVLPRDLWLSPVIFLVLSCALLRLADENYPFWNRTIRTLAAPILASCLAAGWGSAAGFGKAALSAAAKLVKA